MSDPADEFEIPNDDSVSPADIQPGADLTGADLSEAALTGADLSEATLRRADLSEADLASANLSAAVLFDTTLNGVTLARSTEFSSPGTRIRGEYEDDVSKPALEDIIARANHELREAYSDNGLIGRARDARVRERKARRREARAEGGWGYLSWLGSILSQVFTGYGVRLRWIAGLILVLWLGSALVYSQFMEMEWDQSLYYSVVTLTTAPPETPRPGVSTVVAGIETFAGTAATVFLGYVLGTRERI